MTGSMTETKIALTTADGVADCHTFHPAGAGPWPGVISYMDRPGIRRDLFTIARRLASHGYFVALPDLYYRSGRYEPINPTAAFAEGPERERLMKLFQSINNGLVMRDTSVVLDFLDHQAAVAEKIGCVGYCMGGGFALSAAGAYPDRIAAAASFHGGRLATDAPDSPHLLAGRMRATLYIGVAGIDPYFPPEELERLKHALDAAGVRYTLEIYPDVRHGFAVDGVPVYDRDAAERHWTRLLALFTDTLPSRSTEHHESGAH